MVKYMKSTQIGPFNCLVTSANSKSCVILFHGYGANASDLAPLSEVLGGGSTWIFPNGIQKIPIAGAMGRAWFQIDIQALEECMAQGTYRDMSVYRPPDIEKSYQRAREFLDKIESQYDEVFIGGFSQGAMLATELVLRGTKNTRALIVLSGTLLCRSQWSKWASTCQGLKFFQSHGHHDPILSFKQAEALFQMLTGSHWMGEFHSFWGDHEIPPEVIQSLGQFLSRF